MILAPYVCWVALMMALPSTIEMYAVRTAATAALLVAWLWRERRFRVRIPAAALPWGVAVGLAVFAIWVAPEQFAWYRRWFILGDTPAAPHGSAWLVLVRLLGSAFVISFAEELFFRKWLIRFAGFWPMVALFAIEHDRWLVGAVAGVVYGVLYLRRGLAAAVIAHATTNLALGLWVLKTGAWELW